MNFLSCFILLLLIHFLLKTSHGKQRHHNSCAPSACGDIRNISYPFRLKDNPKRCGHPRYELSCENQTTSIYFKSHKYIVQTINYNNYTIRLSDASINDDICSFPNKSLNVYHFLYGYPYSISNYMNLDPLGLRTTENGTAWPITFMSCPFAMNSSSFLKTDPCVNTRHTYIKLGHLNVSDVLDNCSIDSMVMSSLIAVKHKHKNTSLLEIHSSLLYGFELSWFGALCGRKCNCYLDDEGVATCSIFSCRRPNMGSIHCEVENIAITPIIRAVSYLLSIGGLLSLAVRILIVLPCVLGLLICKYRRRHLSMFDLIEDYLQSANNLKPIRYSYSEIKKMSKGFREKLGEGGYGSVYKGKLRSGNDVAIKILSKPKGNGQDFINEVATIGRIHHVNVVKLIGYCAERSKCALVYDFMPKGSLEKYIFNKEKSHSLTCEQKYYIAVGVARGIEYLHRGCDIQILHFDIKPHNVLLDDNFKPKISDFGLARFYSTENNTVILTAARGTIGYVAPELINRGIGSISYKADVYSFGMMLIELVGLKRDIVGDDDKSSQYFPYWIYNHLNEGKDIETGNDDEITYVDGDDYVKRISRKMMIIGLWCIRMSPGDRPSMGDVVKMLENENETLEIPPMPSESRQVALNDDRNWDWEIESTDSISLSDDDAGDI